MTTKYILLSLFYKALSWQTSTAKTHRACISPGYCKSSSSAELEDGDDLIWIWLESGCVLNSELATSSLSISSPYKIGTDLMWIYVNPTTWHWNKFIQGIHSSKWSLIEVNFNQLHNIEIRGTFAILRTILRQPLSRSMPSKILLSSSEYDRSHASGFFRSYASFGT